MLIYNLLRILTPEEINELITTGSGKTRTSLVELMEKHFNSNEEDVVEGAKILPFKLEQEEERLEADQSEEVQEIENREYKLGRGCFKKLRELQLEHKRNLKDLFAEKRKKKIIKDKKEISLFILEEKKKLESASTSLKGKEIIQLYEKNSKVDINLYRKNRQNLQQASQMGVLINKKQA